MTETPIRDAFLEAKDYLEELTAASYQNFMDILARYAHVLRADGPLRSVFAGRLPAVDFETWYLEAQSTRGGMVGSATLTWPVQADKRVALQLELVRKMAAGEIEPRQFSHTFTYAGNSLTANLSALTERVLIPFHRDLVRVAAPMIEEEEPAEAEEGGALPYNFVDPARLRELRSIPADNFDLLRLVRYCEEIDFAFRNRCFLAVAALTRALLDHVPPLFGVSTFSEVANNYGGAKSFRESMQHLNQSARKIGDAHLHVQIRRKEVLPTAAQVNFANDLDVLLAEVVRLLR